MSGRGTSATAGSKEARKESRNESYKQALADLVAANQKAFARLRLSLSVTYWLLLILLTAMFVVGVVLIAKSAVEAGSGNVEQDTLVGLGAGGADLLLLGLARPIERIRQIKSDRAQLFVILSDYQVQTATALLWYNAEKRETILQAADRIRDLTLETVHLIETYMQAGPAAAAVDREAIGRLEAQNQRVMEALGGIQASGTKQVRQRAGSLLRRSPVGVPDVVP